VVVLRRRVDRL
jgi:putative transposase